MKNIIRILLLSWVCMATSCPEKEGENCHTTIRFSNNSEKTLYVRLIDFYGFTDPLNIRKLYHIQGNEKYKVKSDDLNNRNATDGGCIENLFKNNSMTFFYVFDAAVVENTPWDIIARDYLVLKRYDLTLEDLQRLDWKISYPPTEAMKDVEQWPPYGSE